MANRIRLDQIQSAEGNVAIDINTSNQTVTFTNGFIPTALVIPRWANENSRPTGVSSGYIGYNEADEQLEIFWGADPDDGTDVWGTTSGRVTGGVDVSDVDVILSDGNPQAISYVAMPTGGSRTFLNYITSFGVNQNSSNTDNAQWQNGYSGRVPLTASPLTNNNYFINDGGVKFISGDGSSDGGDWAVIDFGPDNNGDFDGYYQNNSRGRFFGGENSSSGGGANGMRTGKLWGFSDSDGWVLLYQLPLGDRQGTWSHRNSNWWNSGGTINSGNGKRSAYDNTSISYIGFSVE